MKVSTLFWGVLFLLIGGLILLDNLGVLNVEWVAIWRLWPLILIFWGLSLIIGKERPKWYVVVLLILLIIFMIIAVFVAEWYDRDYDYVLTESNQQSFVEPYSGAVGRASFALSSGAGKFLLQDTTNQLFDASTQVSFGKYSLTTDRSGDSESLSLRFKGRSTRWNFGRFRNRAEVRLNVHPIWDIEVGTGAASLDFDLSPYKVDHVKIDAGASSLKLRLGDRMSESHVRIRAGASSIQIEVPETVGCEVRAETKLSSRRMRGFEKVGDDKYQTSNFESAAKRISVEIDAGISSVRMSRY